VERTDETFASGSDRCAAWLYRPAETIDRVPCVVMAHGFSLTRHDGLAQYAEAFAAAGAAVLVFDHRHLGDSQTDTPQRFRFAEQREDLRAAVAFARGLEGIDPDRIVLWGFSMSGGHAVDVAAKDPRVAAVIALCPLLDGFRRVLKTSPRLAAWMTPKAIADVAGRDVRIPVTAPVGAKGAMTFAGEYEGFENAVPEGSPWRNEISPGLFVMVATHRPVTKAKKLAMPVWTGLGERDISVSAKTIRKFVARAPKAELHTYPVDHFEPFYGHAPAQIAADQTEFLARTVL
jgi:dienelactone hydrolase